VGRNKHIKYEWAEALNNVIQHTKPDFGLQKGQWNSKQFLNDNPVVLELGCGRGEYTNGLAKIFTDKNFIGVDIKGDRLAAAGLVAQRENLHNVAYLRIMMQFIDDFFEENEVDEIWLTFPDPRLKDRDEKKRLTHPHFLNKYKKVLKPDGILHLKTDSAPFFDYSMDSLPANKFEIIASTNDLYESRWNKDHFGIKTRFEKIFYEKGFPINYLRAVNKKEV
jgi:tRNA (guanine-N7-)-methyltransferase